MKLHVLRQIAPYPNNSLAQSPSKLIRSHAGDWIGGRHLSYSRIGLPNADHPIIQSAQNQQQHYPVVLTLPIIQKGLAFGCERSGTATVPGVSSSSGSCPPARGATAAAAARASMRRLVVTRSSAIDRRNASRSAPRPAFGLLELLVGIHTSHQSCYEAGKARIFTPVRESSGESRLSCVNMGSGRGHRRSAVLL